MIINEHKRVELLMLFLTLAEQLSFTKAAEQLGISKGYLSEKIKQLETHLKTPLVIRTTRSVKLTAQGVHVYEQALRIRTQLFDIEKTTDSQQVAGVIRLTVPKMFASTFLFDICHKFKQLHPNIEFVINSSYRTFNLNQQEFDLAFRATSSPPDNMVANKLFDYEHIIVASPRYLKSSGPIDSLVDLENHHCLTVTEQTIWPFASQQVNINGWLSSNDNHMLKRSAQQGGGLFRIANYFVKDELDSGQLVEVLQQEKIKDSGGLYMLYPQLIYPPYKLRVFIDFVKAYFQ